ncbi:hypothetical protein D3C75_1235020 [compost metagenome]
MGCSFFSQITHKTAPLKGLQLQLMLDDPDNVSNIIPDDRQIERAKHLQDINNGRRKKSKT